MRYYLIGWGLYWLGDILSHVMNIPGMGWIYPAYNACMIKSVDISGAHGLGILQDVREIDAELDI